MTYELTDIERIIISGLQAREAAITQQMAVLRADWTTVFSVLSERLGLDPTSIGQTHVIDVDRWLLVEKPQ